MFRSLGALIGDLLIVILFVAIGLMQHGTPLTSEYLFLVAWPFVAGLLLGHLAIRSWRDPFSLWPRGVFVWAITVAAGMALRTLLGQGAETSFVIVTAAVTGVGMLGWRAVARYLTRGERARVEVARADGAAVPADGAASAAGATTAAGETAPVDGAAASAAGQTPPSRDEAEQVTAESPSDDAR